MRHVKLFEQFDKPIFKNLSPSEIKHIELISKKLIKQDIIKADGYEIDDEGKNNFVVKFKKEKPNKLYFTSFKTYEKGSTGLSIIDKNGKKIPLEKLEIKDYKKHLV